MDKIKTVKIKNEDGSISEESYTISVDARNVDMDNGKDLQYTIGNIDVDTDGNISEQLNKKPYYYNTIFDLKQAQLKNNDVAITLGYYTINDGGAGEYKIVKGTYVEDGGYYHRLNNGLFAELIVKNNTINVKQFGLKSNDNNFDNNTAYLQKIIKSNKNIFFPDGEYIFKSSLTQINDIINLTLEGESKKGTILNFTATGMNLNFSSCSYITIQNLTLTNPTQYERSRQGQGGGTRKLVQFSNSTYITNKDLIICNGVNGIYFNTCSHIDFHHNECYNFTGWSCVWGEALSDCSDCDIYNNICYNGGYDGIKLTGYIKNIKIYNNTCYNNVRDGIDFAGHTCSNISIYDNFLYNNAMQGIDFKELGREDYPIDFSKELVWKNIYIYDNTLTNNYGHGINTQIYYDDVNVHNFIMENNKIIMGDTQNASNAGIRIGSAPIATKRGIVIRNNYINAYNYNYFGIRLLRAYNIYVYDNIIEQVVSSGIYFENQGESSLNTKNCEIINNTIKVSSNSQYGICINCPDNEVPDNCLIKDNKMIGSYNNDSYLIRMDITNNDNNVCIGNEYCKETFDAIPTIRSTKGVIYKSSNPLITGCEGWIGKTNTKPGSFTIWHPIDLS